MEFKGGATMITWAKQQSIKPIAANSQKRFTQVEKEVCDYEISNLIGQKLYSQIEENPGNYKDLLEGCTFEYGGETISHKGLEYVIAYLVFAAYSLENNLQDTYTGMVQKQRPDSETAPVGLVKNLAQRNREIAYNYFEATKKYIEITFDCEQRTEKTKYRLIGIKKTEK